MNFALVGDVGTGKTILTTYLHQLVAQELNIDYGNDREFAMNGDFKFMDTYDATRHLFITLDEWGSMSKDKIDATSVSNLTKITGEAPFQAPMADLNKMGTQYVSHYSTVMTTNSPDFGLVGVITNPGAIARRFIRIEVVVKPEHRVGDTCKINPKLLEQIDTEGEYWDGKVFVDNVKRSDVMSWREVG